jgi:hypothetical protein
VEKNLGRSDVRGVVLLYAIGCAAFIGVVVYLPELLTANSAKANFVSIERVQLQDPLPPPDLPPGISLRDAAAEAEEIVDGYERECRESYQGEGTRETYVETCVNEKLGF